MEDISTAENNTNANPSLESPYILPHKRIFKVIADMKSLLDRIDRDIPLLHLAITGSGESLSTSLPSTISPSRLLQASTFVIMGDSQFAQDSTKPVQIGPTFNLSLYMLFLAHAAPNGNGPNSENRPTYLYGFGKNDKKPIWQEVMHKVAVRLYRSTSDVASQLHPTGRRTVLPTISRHRGYHYYLELREDLNDGRLHDDVDLDAPSGVASSSNRKELIPVQQFSKIFYTDTGKLLNIRDPMDEEARPVLLLKRDANNSSQTTFETERCASVAGCVGDKDDQSQGFDDYQNLIDIQIHHEAHNTSIEGNTTQYSRLSNLPKHLDPEWLALEMFVVDDDNEDDDSEVEDTFVAPDIYYKDEAVSTADSADRTGIDGQTERFHKSPEKFQLDPKPAATMEECSPGQFSNTSQPIKLSAEQKNSQNANSNPSSPYSAITTSLSLLEMMVRLVGLQESQQTSHLSIPDHILIFFLEETSTSGFSGMAGKKMRREAKQRVGFDPYAGDQGH